MRFLIVLLFVSSQAFAGQATTILVEVISPDHYELTISGLHEKVDRITLTSQAQVQKFTGIESQKEFNLKSQPDWYRIWFHDGSDPYTEQGSVARIDFHYSSGKEFTMTPIVPETNKTTDAIMDVKASYDSTPTQAAKLDPATKNKVNTYEPEKIIYDDPKLPDPRFENPP